MNEGESAELNAIYPALNAEARRLSQGRRHQADDWVQRVVLALLEDPPPAGEYREQA